MKIFENEELVLIRYSNMFGYDTILEHKKIIDKLGYCYFGKVGKKTSTSHLKSLMSSNIPKIILKSKNEAYLCIVEDIIFETPNNGYPDYYKEELFKKNNYPSMYYKITKIIKIDKSILTNFVVKSSLNPLPLALQQSMTSQLLIMSENNIDIKEEK